LLEIVLGVDNIIFISILTNKLPKEQQSKGRRIGLALALVMRLGLLFGITWIIGFKEPLFSLFNHTFSGRDVILAFGGLFLLGKSTSEIHHKLEDVEDNQRTSKKTSGFWSIILQIIVLDIVFSFDSILTAIGLTEHIVIMIAAVILSMAVMLIFSGQIADFINKRPSLQMLALSFLILIGFMLVLDGMGQHVPKGYIYFAVAFSMIVEMLNMRLRRKTKPMALKHHIDEDE
jgi:predicted tellurium resistance membrane protein TerC